MCAYRHGNTLKVSVFVFMAHVHFNDSEEEQCG